jgi:U3 small nucleolar RNA-associated protein 11
MGVFNPGKRKVNKERPQPSHTKKRGFLERHKDYVIRAKDYHRKEEVIKNLRRKAALKNPDEYYGSAMSESAIKSKKRMPHSAEVLKAYNTQDLNFLVLKRQQEIAKINKLKADLHHAEKPINSRQFFVESPEQLDSFQVPRASAEPEELDGSQIIGTADSLSLAKIQKLQKKKHMELEAREERLNDLNLMIQKVQLQRNLMGKGARKKIQTHEDEFGDEDPNAVPVYKWRRERKR